MSDLPGFQQNFLSVIDRPEPSSLTPMTVYRNTIFSGAMEALADNFPVVRMLVGEPLFDALALEHVRAYPPVSPVLANYGEAFADWVAWQPIAAEITYLADVARCERLYIEALFASDAPALTVRDLDAVHPEKLARMKLRLHPATRFDWLATPAMHIWLAHQGDTPEEMVIDWRPCGALFCRPYHEVCGMMIGRATHRLLFGIRVGETLGEAAEAARSLYPKTDIGARFADLVNVGAFAALSERN